jgi:hypothetical protein
VNAIALGFRKYAKRPRVCKRITNKADEMGLSTTHARQMTDAASMQSSQTYDLNTVATGQVGTGETVNAHNVGGRDSVPGKL